MLNRSLAGQLQYVQRADDVAVYICSRLLETVADTGLSGEMNDHVRLEVSVHLAKSIEILKHAFRRGEIRALQQVLVTPALQGDVVIIGHPVVAVNDVALFEQQLGKMKANEASRASNQDAFHFFTQIMERLERWLQAHPSVKGW